jgi:hypothetical protein
MRICVVVFMCAFATATIAADEQSSPNTATVTAAVKGNMLFDANGARLSNVYRVNPDGGVQIIMEGKLITVPASSLSTANGKLTTSLSKSAVLALH